MTQPDIYDLLAEAEAEPQPMRGPWPHFIDGVPAHGITSMTPPTVRCDGCGAESAHPTSIHLAVILGGMYFRQQRYGADPRRLCGACAWDEWPEKRTSDHGTPIPRPEPIEATQAVAPSGTCPRCDHRHTIGGDTTVAGSRFTRPIRYRALYPDAPARTTREQAIRDMCDHRAAQHAARNDDSKEHRA